MRYGIAVGIGLAITACAASSPAPATPPTGDVRFEDGVLRLDLRFPCGSVRCAGWLYLPAGSGRPPVVVMGHGFSGTRDVGMPVFARAFASRGIAAFAFDYRCFGASGGSPRQLIDPWQQLDDWRAALAFVRTRAEVDTGRLAIWGTSMGGGLVIVIGAEDPDVSAIVAQVPSVDTDVEPTGPRVSLGWGVRLLFTAWADLARSVFTGDALMIPAFAPPGEFGMISDDEAYADIELLRVSGSTWRNEIAARSILTFDEYNPADSWDGIQVPTLLLGTERDRLAPFEAVRGFAAANPHVTLETFEGGHFDVYLPPTSDAAAELEADFLLDVWQATR